MERPRSCPTRISRELTRKSIPKRARMRAGCNASLNSSVFQVESEATLPLRHRAASTRPASSDTACLTATVRFTIGQNLISVVMVGDGESETGPMATSWHSNKFLNPVTDGAVLPVLHLNGYKINNPTILARISHEELESLFVGYGYTPYFVEGSDPESMH